MVMMSDSGAELERILNGLLAKLAFKGPAYRAQARDIAMRRDELLVICTPGGGPCPVARPLNDDTVRKLESLVTEASGASGISPKPSTPSPPPSNDADLQAKAKAGAEAKALADKAAKEAKLAAEKAVAAAAAKADAEATAKAEAEAKAAQAAAQAAEISAAAAKLAAEKAEAEAKAAADADTALRAAIVSGRSSRLVGPLKIAVTTYIFASSLIVKEANDLIIELEKEATRKGVEAEGKAGAQVTRRTPTADELKIIIEQRKKYNYMKPEVILRRKKRES